MRAPLRTLGFLALFFAVFCPARAEEAQLRAAITKGLGFLAKDGDRWMDERDCTSCHHMPALLWSHREAAERGFAIDQKKFGEWLEWVNAQDASKKPVAEQAAYTILALPERSAPVLAKAIIDRVLPDGSWKPAGQLSDMQLRGPVEAKAYTMRLLLLALATSKDAGDAAEAARARAAAYFSKEVPARSVDTLMYRLLYAKKFGPPGEVTGIRDQLLKRQRRDGGWSYILDENQSDALGTGEALYALAAAPDASTEKAAARAQEWLLSTQQEDGGWATDYTHLSKIDRSGPERAKSRKDIEQIYGYWGTAWATIGLLQAFPVTPPAPSL